MLIKSLTIVIHFYTLVQCFLVWALTGTNALLAVVVVVQGTLWLAAARSTHTQTFTSLPYTYLKLLQK